MLVPSELADRLLRELAARLEAEGLEVRAFGRDQEITEIQVRNPQKTGAGQVCISYDGYLTWELWLRFESGSDISQIHELMRKMLTRGESNAA